MTAKWTALAALSLTGALAAQAQDTAADTVIHAGTLIAEPGESPTSEQSILIANGQIVGVEDGFVSPDGAKIIDLSDDYVLPGLIDSHVHITGELNPNARLLAVTDSDGDVAYKALAHAQTTLRAGFTTIQDVGAGDVIFDLRDAINAGTVQGPRILASGRALSPTGGHGDTHGYRQEILDLAPNHTICDGVADCRRATREAIKRGADVIKITATGGVLSNTAAGVERQFFDDELEAIVQTAAQMGRKVTAHAHGTTGINAALQAGVASIEHGSYLDTQSIRLFRNNDAVLVPTLLAGKTVTDWASEPWLPEPSRIKAAQVGPVMLENTRLAYEGGVTIAFGTDSGVSAHGDNAQEFALMVEVGMTPAEAIRSATVVAAAHVGLADEIGTIEAGKAADIIAVDGDPLADVNELLEVDFVMKDGAIVKSED